MKLLPTIATNTTVLGIGIIRNKNIVGTTAMTQAKENTANVHFQGTSFQGTVEIVLDHVPVGTEWPHGFRIAY